MSISKQSVFKFTSVFSCSMFSGAALYINLVEHPARMECGTQLASTVFPGSYRRAAKMQASLALIGCVSSIISYHFYGASKKWLAAGLLLGSVVPFTLLAIMPTNKKLLDPKVDKDASNTHDLLTKWGKLHAVRTVTSIGALILFLLNW